MANITWADRTNNGTPTGSTDEADASIYNTLKYWMNSPSKSLATFNPSAITLDGSGTYAGYTVAGNITLAFTGTPIEGNWQKVRTTGWDGTYTFTVPNNTVIVNNSFTQGGAVATGTYDLWFAYVGGEYQVNLVPVSIATVDTTAPQFVTASFEVGNVANNIVVLPVDEALDSGSVPAVGDFDVQVSASPNVVTNVDITTNSQQVRLTLTTAVTNGQTVTAAYTKGVNPLQDASGNETPSLTATAVTNNVPASYEPEAEALFTRMATAGSEPDATRKGHINTLIAGLKTDGNWAKLDCLHIYAAHAESVSKLNWKEDDHNGTANGTTSFTIDRGYTGDGSTAYIDTDFIPSADYVNASQDSIRAGAYVRTAPTSGIGKTLFGANRNSTATTSSISISQGASNMPVRVNDFGAGDATDADQIFNANTLYSVDRVTLNNIRCYQDTTNIISTTAVTSTGNPDRSIYVLADNRESVPGAAGFIDAEVMMFYVGAGAATGEITIGALKSRVDTYLTAIGAI